MRGPDTILRIWPETLDFSGDKKWTLPNEGEGADLILKVLRGGLSYAASPEPKSLL